jgi:hypothetical protein
MKNVEKEETKFFTKKVLLKCTIMLFSFQFNALLKFGNAAFHLATLKEDPSFVNGFVMRIFLKGPEPSVTKLFCPQFTDVNNKLEGLSLTSF